jgi:hypothetical protein
MREAQSALYFFDSPTFSSFAQFEDQFAYFSFHDIKTRLGSRIRESPFLQIQVIIYNKLHKQDTNAQCSMVRLCSES